MASDTTPRRNGSRPAYPQRLTWAQHEDLAARLGLVQEELARVQAAVTAAYGRSNDQAKRAAAVLTEHGERAPRALSELYYPREART